MTYKVKLNIFEGPLDLLLFLIKKDKIDVYDIPIAAVTEQYLEYMELLKLLDLEIAGEFLVMAATLMHIKSKMLLPADEVELEDEEEEDPREELVRRLLEYKKYKEAANQLQQMHSDHKSIFLRRGDGSRGKVVAADGKEYFEANLFDLIVAFRKILKEVPKEAFHKVIKDEFSVSDKIHEILHLLSKQSRVRFLSLFKKTGSKDEVIVIFLAILELMKMQEIFVAQREPFGDIEIIRASELMEANNAG